MADLLLSAAQFVIAILLGAASIFAAFYLLQLLTKDIDEWAELRAGNQAVGIVAGAAILAIAIILQPALALHSYEWDLGRRAITMLLLAQALQLLAGIVFAVLALLLAAYAFTWMTQGLEEKRELLRGNQAVALFFSGALLGMALLVSQAVRQLSGAITRFLL